MRLMFRGEPESAFAAMLDSFIFGSPMLVGAVTVYLAERRARRTWSYYFLAPALATLLYVVGTLLVIIEGWICAILILPLFAVVGGLAGLAMGLWYAGPIADFLIGNFEENILKFYARRALAQPTPGASS